MFPCKFCLSTRSIHELAARRAIKALEGTDIEDVSEYIDPSTDQYRKMVEWIARDLSLTTLRYQTVEDMLKAIGLPKEKLLPVLLDRRMPRIKNRGGLIMPRRKDIKKL